MKFEVLYHFSHGSVHLVETKRLDLPSAAEPGEIYQWSLVEDKVVHLLHFHSMSMNPQRRTFEEGSIEFNLNSCTGQLRGKALELTRQDKMNDSLTKILERSFKEKSLR